MIHIYIFADALKQFNEPVKEYEKRLGKQVTVCKLKPVKKGEPRDIIAAETKILQDKLKGKNAYKIVLSPGGKQIGTHEFHSMIEEKKQIYPDMIFCIGGAYGFDYNLIGDQVHMHMNISSFVMPHGLALSVLLEQIYRANMIEKGSDYHK